MRQRLFSLKKLAGTILIFMVLLLVTANGASGANAVPPRPSQGYIYDENRLLSASQAKFFNAMAQELFQKTGVGIACALLNDIGDNEPRTLATNIAHSWGIGGKTDEGILIFVAMKQRRRSVEVGYGAESYLPDLLVEKLQQKTLIPAFRKERYGEGILLLAYNLAQTVAKEKGVSLNLENADVPEDAPVNAFGWIFILLVFLFIAANARIGGNSLFWFLLGASQSHNHRGGNGFGGGFGGFGGNGFGGGGFGGGRFGGGGSGGSW